MPVLAGLIKYIDEKNIPFHMPGHKGNINSFKELEFLQERLYEIDKTEVPGLDNLHVPSGMILEGQKLAARAFKAKESFFLVNGSTCGIYSMLMGVTRPGDKVIIQRNCHRAVFMAALLGDLCVEYIDPEINKEFKIPGGIGIDNLIAVMEKNLEAKAIVITYPSYYGICSDIKAIVREAHKRNMLVLVDEAHGAHLSFSPLLPKPSMVLGGDVSVISLHKSLPALTQTSLLNVGKGIDDKGIKFMLGVFQTTSPSYVLMASIDAARNIMESRGEKLLGELLVEIEKFKEKMLSLKSYRLLGINQIGRAAISDIDITKIVIAGDIGGRALEKKLRREYNIQVEMCDTYNIILIASVGDCAIYFEKLYEALYNIDKECNNIKVQDLFYKQIKYEMCLNLREAYYSNKISIALLDAEGYISGEMVVPYPPGIPILLPGEIITQEIIDYLIEAKEAGIVLNGIADETGEKVFVLTRK